MDLISTKFSAEESTASRGLETCSSTSIAEAPG